jgi:NAD(P)H-dependent flavin oxidoreductase YrpB (nitropropane dioxygenase family)
MLPKIICLTPFETPSITLLRAIARTEALGVLDAGRNPEATLQAIAQARSRGLEAFGVKLYAHSLGMPLPNSVRCVILDEPAPLDRLRHEDRVFVTQVTSIDEAEIALRYGTDALIAKGTEAGGRVGMETTFVLLQRLLARTDKPIWAQGGIGLNTAAAVLVAGARGIVLDAQLALAKECQLPEATARLIAAMDGGETRVHQGVRSVRRRSDVASTSEPDVIPVGQDGAFARELAATHVTATRMIAAFEQSMVAIPRQARHLLPLAPNAGVSAEHGTHYPIVQGPMTRVSDRPELATAVAARGGLPLLALALMSATETRSLLERTAAALGDQPWGVGILGFAPEEIRNAQLSVVCELKPKVALVAGARKALVRQLTEAGITSYVHVPSPTLLDQFLQDGMTHFVLEGSECGGHIGPRTSFTLWEQAVTRLCREDDLKRCHVLFAGGIHDALSAAMVSVIAAPLCARGARVGVLVGTAYLFTREAVETGAIVETFQRQVLEADRTVVLESAPGHAIRALNTEFCARFETERARLEQAGLPSRAVSAALEELNLGRLRIATKGTLRDGGSLVNVDADQQRREGLFMSGQVAALRDRPTTIAELHSDLSEGSTRAIERAVPGQQAASRPSAPPIAIVGMACLFPDANDLDEYWSNILNAKNCIREVPETRWRHSLYYGDNATGDRTTSKWGGFIPAQCFDALEIGVTPRALAAMDPAQVLALLVVRRALANAGVVLEKEDTSRVSVIWRNPGGDRAPYDRARALSRAGRAPLRGWSANVCAGRRRTAHWICDGYTARSSARRHRSAPAPYGAAAPARARRLRGLGRGSADQARLPDASAGSLRNCATAPARRAARPARPRAGRAERERRRELSRRAELFPDYRPA